MNALSLYTITCTAFWSSIVLFKVGIKVDKVWLGSTEGLGFTCRKITKLIRFSIEYRIKTQTKFTRKKPADVQALFIFCFEVKIKKHPTQYKP